MNKFYQNFQFLATRRHLGFVLAFVALGLFPTMVSANFTESQVVERPTPVASDYLGSTLDVSGDYMIVGLTGSNRAEIFHKVAGVWSHQDSIVEAGISSYFADDVTISGDWAVVADNNDGTGGGQAGAVFLYKRDGTSWNFVKKVISSDIAASDFFGDEVIIKGDYLVVGAYRDDDGGSAAGSAYIFHKDQGGVDNWGQIKKLTASDGAAGDWFGRSLAMSDDNQYVVVGAYTDDDGFDAAGSVYIYHVDQGGADNWGQIKKLNASDPEIQAWFGNSVGVSEDGEYVVVGAYGKDDAGAGSGAAYVFKKDSGGANNWGQIKKLNASDGAASDQFGKSIAIRNDVVLVGAHLVGAGDVGAAYVFKKDEGGIDNWGQSQILTASNGADNDWFGFKVVLDGYDAFVGADGYSLTVNSGGAVYYFEGTPPVTPENSIVIDSVYLELINDVDANNILNIGDTFRVFVNVYNSDYDTGAGEHCMSVPGLTTVTVDLSAYGGAVDEAMECTEHNSGQPNTFTVTFEVADAGVNGIDVGADDPLSAVTATVTDLNETTPKTAVSSNRFGDGVRDNLDGVDSIAPDVVANFATTAATLDSISLSWDASVTADFAEYVIYYSTDENVSNSNGTLWDSGDDADLSVVGTTSTVVTGLTQGTRYYFQIYQVDDADNLSPAATRVDRMTASPASGGGVPLIAVTNANLGSASGGASSNSNGNTDFSGSPFEDIRGHWAGTYVEELRAKGVVAGKSADSFAPEDAVTRAELLKMVLEAYGVDIETRDTSSFSDVSAQDWFIDYVETAKMVEYISGYEDGTFRPNEFVNRAEALAIILKASELALNTGGSHSFPDVSADAWYVDLISFAVENAVVSGYENGNFGPSDSMTRAQVAKVIVLVMKLKGI
ncbi:hypothetical protein CVV38_01240 [Candidatus Peregrinibacteria bacterium HGW-Peregrinibacteria-1]|jgi:hypothetical protein|nr:MAG: hypothetical protein CVV38_01240 [Candidatus Peregrinibacteria bacterium HGW-Peregrinibacteria-1]